MLNGGTFSAIPRQDGSFKLHAVPAGTYLLEVLDTQSLWPTVRLEVTPSGKPRAMLSHSRQPLPFPLPLEPLVAKPTFFEKREGFQWSQMLMNPMVMMMGVTVMIMFVFPKMMVRRRRSSPPPPPPSPRARARWPTPPAPTSSAQANMDPEQLKEMQSMQGGLADMLNPEKQKEKLEMATKKEKRERR